MMMKKERETNHRFLRVVVAGVLALFLAFAFLNATLQTKVQAQVAQEIREVTSAEHVYAD